MNAALSTVKDQVLCGLLHTTWHTLTNGMPYVAMAAAGCFGEEGVRKRLTATAALLRKVMPIGGDYQKAGWSKNQVGYRW